MLQDWDDQPGQQNGTLDIENKREQYESFLKIILHLKSESNLTMPNVMDETFVPIKF